MSKSCYFWSSAGLWQMGSGRHGGHSARVAVEYLNGSYIQVLKSNLCRIPFRVAAWKSTCHDHVAFSARFTSPNTHPLLSEMLRLGPHSWALDLLHVADYHGVSSHAIASLLVEAIRDAELGLGTHQASLDWFPETVATNFRKSPVMLVAARRHLHVRCLGFAAHPPSSLHLCGCRGIRCRA